MEGFKRSLRARETSATGQIMARRQQTLITRTAGEALSQSCRQHFCTLLFTASETAAFYLEENSNLWAMNRGRIYVFCQIILSVTRSLCDDCGDECLQFSRVCAALLTGNARRVDPFYLFRVSNSCRAGQSTFLASLRSRTIWTAQVLFCLLFSKGR